MNAQVNYPQIVPSSHPAHKLWNKISDDEKRVIFENTKLAPVRIGVIGQQLGLSITSTVLGPNISGLIRRNLNQTFEVQVNRVDSPTRQRFTVAHEISHFLIHRDLIDNDGITDSILYRSNLAHWQEAQANSLAAAMLMPENLVKSWMTLNKVIGDIDESHLPALASYFKVSSLAMRFRVGL